MGYDEALAGRIRKLLGTRTDVAEKKMFGGLCFMVNGAMCCGLTKTDFMVRVGPARYEEALAEPHTRPMDFTGRPLTGMVYVAPEGVRSAPALRRWVECGVTFVSSMPAKADPRVARLMRAFGADPRLAPVVAEFEANKGGKKFGSNGLKVNGKLFALFTQGTLVVKLPSERVSALVRARVGTPFDPGRGRLMKEWLTVAGAKASWIDLAKEAHDFVTGKGRAMRTTR